MLADLDPSTMGQSEEDKKKLNPGAVATGPMDDSGSSTPTDEMSSPNAPSGSPAMLGAGGGGTTAGGPMGSGAQSSQESGPVQKGSSSGRFQNIQKFLNANRGAQFASQVGQNISSQGTQARQQTDTTRSQVQDAVRSQLEQKQGTIGQARDALGRLVPGQAAEQAPAPVQEAPKAWDGGEAPPSAPPASQVQQPVIPTREAVDLNEAENALRAGMDIRYQGPEDVENADKLREQARQVAERADMSGTERGRFQLLRDMFGTPQYSSGQQRLDQAILGQRGQGELAKARESVADLPDYTTNTIEGLRGEIGDARSAFGQERANLVSDIGAGEGAMRSELQGLTDQARAARADQAATFGTDINNLQPAWEQLVAQSGDQLRGAQLVDSPEGPMIEIPSAAGTVRVPAERLLGGGFMQTVGSADDVNLGNVDREGAERLNVLARLSGQNEQVPLGELQALQGQMNQGQVLGEIGRLAGGFKASGDMGVSAKDAQHYLTHNQDATKGFFNRLSSGGDWQNTGAAAFMTPQEIQAIEKALRSGGDYSMGAVQSRGATGQNLPGDSIIQSALAKSKERAAQQIKFDQARDQYLDKAKSTAFGGPGSGLVGTF